MPNKLKPKDSVQAQAESYGYRRVLVDNDPMIIRQGRESGPLVDTNPKRRAKVIGKSSLLAILAARG